MAILDFKNGSLQTQILPKINSTIDNLNNLIVRNNEIYVPSDFEYSGLINNYRQAVGKIRDNYVAQRSYLLQANKTLDNAIGQMNDDLLRIRKVEVKRHTDSV